MAAFKGVVAPRALDSSYEIIAGVDGGKVSAFRADGEEPIWNFSINIPNLENVHDIELVDLTDDGVLDVVAAGRGGVGRACVVALSTQVPISGDINGDWTVDIYDAIILANAYNSKPGDPSWIAAADINGDNLVDIYDAIILAGSYGKTT